ncbi:hypothetical protein [Natronorubrum texcoconense]|nr:hypothetical protein [Natronorubrum texcoconense]
MVWDDDGTVEEGGQPNRRTQGWSSISTDNSETVTDSAVRVDADLSSDA